MNIITRIALSLSLVALIAQPIQSKPWMSDKTKKIAKHSAQMLVGSLALAGGIGFAYGNVQVRASLAEFKAFYDRAQKTPEAERSDREKKLIKHVDFGSKCANKALGLAAVLIPTGSALLYCGIKGLKQEICPQFNPITWVKNKLSNKTQQSA